MVFLNTDRPIEHLHFFFFIFFFSFFWGGEGVGGGREGGAFGGHLIFRLGSLQVKGSYKFPFFSFPNACKLRSMHSIVFSVSTEQSRPREQSEEVQDLENNLITKYQMLIQADFGPNHFTLCAV